MSATDVMSTTEEKRTLPPTLIETPGGERLVLLPEAEYRSLLSAAEGRAKTAETIVPAGVASRIFAGENPVRVYREWRGLTGRELAAQSGLSAGHISDIESGRRSASAEARATIAALLGLAADDLLPANMS